MNSEKLEPLKHVVYLDEGTQIKNNLRLDSSGLAHQKLIGEAKELGRNCIRETGRKLQAIHKVTEGKGEPKFVVHDSLTGSLKVVYMQAALRVGSSHDLINEALPEL